MERIYTYKFRLYPNDEQKIYLANVFGCCRFVYNYFLSEKKHQYEETKTSDSYNIQQSKLTLLRKTNGFEFLNDVPLQALQYSLRNMHIAYENFYKKRCRFPKFKIKRSRQVFRISQPNTFHVRDGKLFIPKLKSGIDITVSKDVVGDIRFAVITKNKSGHYYILITSKQEYEPYKKTNCSVGLDLGIKDFVTTSDGIKYPNQHKYVKILKRNLKYNQKCLSRKIRGSKRYEKQVLKCNRIYEKITNIKTDYIHKITTELVRNYDVIKVEDLNIKGMIKNHKLAEIISECNWYQFVTTLEYKCVWNNKILEKIDRFYPSSQTCNVCGYINKSVKNLNIRKWLCPNCGTYHDRDINAAKNILNYISARNVDYSRGVINKSNEISNLNGDYLNNNETINKPKIKKIKE